MELGKKKKQVLHGDPLSLTRKSYLTWVGFSAEGTKRVTLRNLDTAGGILEESLADQCPFLNGDLGP